MNSLVERLLAGIESYGNLGRVSTSAGLIREAAARIEDLERQLEDEKARSECFLAHRLELIEQLKTNRLEAMEEFIAALSAHELYQYRPKAFRGFFDYVRALSDSRPTPLQEQSGNSGEVEG